LQRSLQDAGEREGYDFEAEYMEALCMRDPCLIKLFLRHQQKLKRLRYRARLQALFSGKGPSGVPSLSSLPDLQFSVKWHCDSDFIPFLSRLAPHDTIMVYRSRTLDRLRIDFNQAAPNSMGQGNGEAQMMIRPTSTGKRPMSLLFKEGAV
jgi:hypothetical protein